MQVKEIKSKKFFKEYSVEIPSKKIEEETDNKIRELAPKTNLPGFRPGKAPLNLIKKKYEKDILGDVINNVINESSKKLLDEKKFKPLRVPKIAITKFEKNKFLEFNIKIDLPPEFELFAFEKIKLDKYNVSFSKKELDGEYKKFIDSQSHYHSIKESKKIMNKDQLLISLNSIDNNLPTGFKNQDQLAVIIGSDYQFLPNLDKSFLGKKIKKDDELIIEIDISDGKKNKTKKTYKFKTKIIDIREPHEVKIDEEYLKKNNLKSLDELKEKVEKNIKNQYNLISSEISKKQLLDTLEQNHKFELPDGILADENNSIWERVENAKKEGKLDPDDLQLNEKELKVRYEKIAKRRVKLALIISHIANKNNISVNQEEITQGLMDYSRQYPGQEKQIFEFFKKNPAEIEIIRGPLFEKKVIEHIMKKITKVNKDINIKEITKLQSKVFNGDM